MYLISSKVFCRVEYREKNNSGTSLTNVIGIIHIREKDFQREECVVFVVVYRARERER
jgi:hypothetical protein